MRLSPETGTWGVRLVKLATPRSGLRFERCYRPHCGWLGWPTMGRYSRWGAGGEEGRNEELSTLVCELRIGPYTWELSLVMVRLIVLMPPRLHNFDSVDSLTMDV